MCHTMSLQKRLMSQAEVEDIEHRRTGRKANFTPVVMGAYDMKFCGRAVPSCVMIENTLFTRGFDVSFSGVAV